MSKHLEIYKVLSQTGRDTQKRKQVIVMAVKLEVEVDVWSEKERVATSSTRGN